ncbi:hypothetical protein RFI_05188 [Reticulomyxa filosa]|uniref:Uncharacterized protein n=1 Tax=Reticulomyxa filosa TaxID=46433 RepID=X6P2Z6_RETFI|nr:hypothetical protein RFI_05188 [Reticulomyxa filosa]|eukprot:ETO31932.1 hypothetical protein RFI_05188 [Reticulomyxa filosa]
MSPARRPCFPEHGLNDEALKQSDTLLSDFMSSELKTLGHRVSIEKSGSRAWTSPALSLDNATSWLTSQERPRNGASHGVLEVASTDMAFVNLSSCWSDAAEDQQVDATRDKPMQDKEKEKEKSHVKEDVAAPQTKKKQRCFLRPEKMEYCFSEPTICNKKKAALKKMALLGRSGTPPPLSSPPPPPPPPLLLSPLPIPSLSSDCFERRRMDRPVHEHDKTNDTAIPRSASSHTSTQHQSTQTSPMLPKINKPTDWSFDDGASLCQGGVQGDVPDQTFCAPFFFSSPIPRIIQPDISPHKLQPSLSSHASDRAWRHAHVDRVKQNFDFENSVIMMDTPLTVNNMSNIDERKETPHNASKQLSWNLESPGIFANNVAGGHQASAAKSLWSGRTNNTDEDKENLQTQIQTQEDKHPNGKKTKLKTRRFLPTPIALEKRTVIPCRTDSLSAEDEEMEPNRANMAPMSPQKRKLSHSSSVQKDLEEEIEQQCQGAKSYKFWKKRLSERYGENELDGSRTNSVLSLSPK